MEGLAPNKGLFVPEQFPNYKLDEFLQIDDIRQIAVKFLQPFFEGDPLHSELEGICADTFKFPIILKEYDANTAMLELFHGPTGAFKDVGARFLASSFDKIPGKKTILVATSGDTGSAVGSAFHGKERSRVLILYPKDKISDFQEKQLVFWDNNVRAVRVAGDFDDCQRLVKEAFSEVKLTKEFNLTSANSINIGRLLPQAIYYIYAALQYYRDHGVSPNFIIPTGNMGNSLACIWAKIMGFPIGKIVLSSNANKPIPDYFATHTFEPRPSIRTLANAMDVGSPSNMERFIHLVESFPDIINDIQSISVTDEEIKTSIQYAYDHWQEMVCPHTATGVFCKNALQIDHVILVGTAHPYKFNEILQETLSVSAEIPATLEKYISSSGNPIDIAPNLSSLTQVLSDHDVSSN